MIVYLLQHSYEEIGNQIDTKYQEIEKARVSKSHDLNCCVLEKIWVLQLKKSINHNVF